MINRTEEGMNSGTERLGGGHAELEFGISES
jgi:hypothetical protein